jgi:hypothetical protein
MLFENKLSKAILKALKRLVVSGFFCCCSLLFIFSSYYEKSSFKLGAKPLVMVEFGELSFGAIPMIPFWSSKTV